MDDIGVVEFLFNDDIHFHNVVRAVVDNADIPVEFNRRQIPTRNQNYYENTVPNYSISEFKSHFRMSRECAEYLMTLVAPGLPGLEHRVPPSKQILFSIWILSKQESFLAVSDRFAISSGTGHYIFKNFISVVIQFKERFIQWPNEQECIDISRRIEDRSGFPGIIGAIDGTHVQIKQPSHNGVDFFNRKDTHSVILQAVCNDKLLFTDVFVGMPGRAHDARVFRNSPLFHTLNRNPPLIQPHQHILGDAAYPLMANLLKPYRDNGHLNPRQSNFNRVLSSQRSIIERAFGQLKDKWRRLKYLDMSSAQVIPEVILAACILHNLTIKENDAEHMDENINDNEDNEQVEGNIDDRLDNGEGNLKRDYIASVLLPN